MAAVLRAFLNKALFISGRRIVLFLVAKHAGLGECIDQWHTHIHDQHRKSHAIWVAAIDANSIGQDAHAGGKNQFAFGRGGAADWVSDDEKSTQQRSAADDVEYRIGIVARVHQVEGASHAT